MPKKFEPLDLSKIKTYSLSDRLSKVSTTDFAKTAKKGASFKNFLNGLPNILAGSDLKSVISAMSAAAGNKKTIIDVELAMAGHTSEDVATAIDDGSFGMAQDTAVFLGNALAESQQDTDGLGQAVGRAIQDNKLPFSEQSILAAGVRLGIPVTVHVAIGTDIIHMHPQFDAARTGIMTHRDFRLFSSVVATLQQGVYLNVGSAVILPEIFLKAVALARNLGHALDHFTTVNLDMVKHYRPLTNVINRPTAKGGKGINLVGHHEIMLPLIAAGVIEQLG
jgi:hypothetical protein